MTSCARLVDLFALCFKVGAVAIAALLTLMFFQRESDQRVIDTGLIDAGARARRQMNYMAPVTCAYHPGVQALTRRLLLPDFFMTPDAFNVRRPQ